MILSLANKKHLILGALTIKKSQVMFEINLKQELVFQKFLLFSPAGDILLVSSGFFFPFDSLGKTGLKGGSNIGQSVSSIFVSTSSFERKLIFSSLA